MDDIIIENDTPLIFDEDEITKHLTKTEGNILYSLYEKMYAGRREAGYRPPVCMEDKIAERVKNVCDYRATFVIRFDYKSAVVVEVEDPRQKKIEGCKIIWENLEG